MLTKIKGAVQGWMDNQQAQSHARANLRGYADCLGRMLLDFNLSPQELQALDQQRRSLGLDPRGVHEVHKDALVHLSNAVLADGVVTAQELQALSQVGSALGVAWTDLPPHHLRTYQIAHTCMQIQAGQLPVVPPNMTSLREAPGEVVHAEIASQILDEKVVARQYSGGYSGMSVRICKGVSYRFGSTRGRSIPVTAIVPVDYGVLSITNKRIAFIGQKKSFSVDWPKVLSAYPMSDGVHLAFQSRSKSALVKYLHDSESEVLTAILAYYMQ